MKGNLKRYLEKAYMHPVFKDEDSDDYYEDGSVMVPTTRLPRRNTPGPSRTGGGLGPLLPEVILEERKP